MRFNSHSFFRILKINFILFAMLLFIQNQEVFAQTESNRMPVLADPGGFGNAPFGYGSFNFYFSSQIITKQELNLAGISGKSVFSALQVRIAGFISPDFTPSANTQFIFIRNIGSTDQFSGNSNPIPDPNNPPTDFVKVFQGTKTWAHTTAQFIQIDFQRSFIWDGNENIELVCINNGGGTKFGFQFIGSSLAAPPYTVNRFLAGGGASLPATGTLATAAYTKIIVFQPTGNQPSNTSDDIGFAPRINANTPAGEVFSLIKDPSTTPLSLFTNVFKSPGGCGSVEFAWVNPSGNWWNGSSFASATPLYSAAYASITATAGSYALGQYSARARCSADNNLTSSTNSVEIYLLNGNVLYEDFGSGSTTTSIAAGGTYNGWTNNSGTSILLECPGEFTGRGYKVNSASTVCNPSSTNYGLRSLIKGIDLSSASYSNYTLTFETRGAWSGAYVRLWEFPVTNSSTLTSIDFGSKTFIVQTGLPQNLYKAGKYVQIVNGANSMTGSIESYNSANGQMVVTVFSSTGSGNFSSWAIKPFTDASAALNADYSWVNNPPNDYRLKQTNLNISSTGFDLEFYTGTYTGFPFKLDEIYITGWPACASPASPTIEHKN
jgi:hypothetical protein